MKKGELDFFRTVASSEASGTVYMCNSIPMEDLTVDAAYMREWMQSIAMMIRKGADIRMIHDVDRPSDEMLLGLMSWIPLYMTASICRTLRTVFIAIQTTYRILQCSAGNVSEDIIMKENTV